ncbi:DUF6879 family protein [Nocardiopsis dassonvillei]|uniref:DUF6879 domain-containing protein n=1 Tax=Nocardiopsis dassonvillei (strain ATCC 23218 / DSM 43111 / CIP 107115 / JCM 7437 / KCTC 9190 / NBRC 14626 / NCTC 10488 / NRRL B-5397 / IMRU 509) TaxID=446468 RepID=D7AYS9_NOCDD|nr:DUF6879 family protein [Nocardiopsis dassonvillei]ADH68091.1 conserved hypothetical protein [Nocardiopsis dassonvillei subsp. dassonvillei DSM 43111]APC36239.1 hypothetical protein A9R04_16765 [Nocardiopsis dassonvillei]NKY77264.1 hypothetical protein [Nocardiopsis dassonvillei]VEI88591.1 Uncharacterised protein [Nocardiopsis dassonvillei]
MLDTIAALPGDRLTLDEYSEDFDVRFGSLRNTDVWKLERQQEFDQPEEESWLAFADGRRDEALRMMEEERASLRTEFDRLAGLGCRIRRVRVVEKPIPLYLLWELHSLRIRAQCGEDIRVISAKPVAPFERERPVPELLTLGDAATYRIRYDDRGILDGAVRYTDPDVTARCRSEIAALHKTAEAMEEFFIREVGGAEVACV